MSELRKDIVTREWVIIAPERADREPHRGLARSTKLDPQPGESTEHVSCPFCPGREELEPEIWAWRAPGGLPNSPQWDVRVVPNKYPALEMKGPASRHDYAIYDCMSGVGAHEIVIETPLHDVGLAELSTDHLAHVVEAYQARYRALSEVPGIAHVSVFKNHGWAAGETVRHAHSQIVATPVIPQLVWDNMQGQAQYREYRDACVYCSIVETEQALDERLIAANDHFVAVSPFASRYPFEVWIIPQRHAASFAYVSADERLAFAQVVRTMLSRLAEELNDPPYNYTIFSPPCQLDQDTLLHWHMEIIPRLSVIAGFELGSNIFINTVRPEDACQSLRADPERSMERSSPHSVGS
jgi:UDPglucose--hexose-1-phosphate uridylyltransferase